MMEYIKFLKLRYKDYLTDPENYFRFLYEGYLNSFHPIKCSLPYTIQIELTSICNFSCTGCPTRGMPQKEKGFMKMETFSSLLDLIPKPIKFVRLFGLGEPFLYPNFLDVVRMVREKGAYVLFHTNASLMTTKDIERIVEYGANVNFSVDSISSNIASPKSLLGQTIKKIKIMSDLKRKNKSSTKIGICCTVWKDNFVDVLKIVDVARELKVDSIHVQNAMHYSIKSFQNSVHHLGWKKVKTVYKEAMKRAKKYGLRYRFPSFREEKVCPFPWTDSYISFDGSVMLCPYVQHSFTRYDFVDNGNIVFKEIPIKMPEFTLGNINKKSFEKIWNEKKYQAIRRIFLSDKKNWPEICKGCVMRCGIH